MSLPGAEKDRTSSAPTWFFIGQVDETLPALRVQIDYTPFTVGRVANLPLTINCECVSKEHAQIIQRDRDLFLRDLESMNGTYVNGERINSETPIKDGDLIQFGTAIFRVCREANAKGSLTTQQSDSDRSLSIMQFDRLLHEESVVPLYQPIVEMDDNRRTLGFEILGRSDLFGLQMPTQMFEVASQLNLSTDLSQMMRRRGLELAKPLPKDANLFINTHPSELAEEGLVDSLREVRENHPDQIITIEIHEASITSPDHLRELGKALAELSIGLAFDDFGAGRDRLIELTNVAPDYLKFDMNLIQGIDRASPSQQRMVAALVEIVKATGCVPLAKGVESISTHHTLQQLGFELGQGHFYGPPMTISKCLGE